MGDSLEFILFYFLVQAHFEKLFLQLLKELISNVPVLGTKEY
jgi:hypothetical protein